MFDNAFLILLSMQISIQIYGMGLLRHLSFGKYLLIGLSLSRSAYLFRKVHPEEKLFYTCQARHVWAVPVQGNS